VQNRRVIHRALQVRRGVSNITGFRASDGQTRGCAEAANRPESIYEIGSSGIAESLDILLDHREEAPNWNVPSYFGIDAHRKLVLDSDKCNRQ
jgi:hypothetical protein